MSFKRRGAATVLDGLRQEGCLKARFPRVEPDAWATAVTLNTSGGVAGGDRLSLAFAAGQGARACVASQAAERFYRSVSGGAASRVRTRVTVAEGGALEWLPQETILFNQSAVDRRLEVDLAPDGWFLGVESLVFGRAAMGERVEQAWLRDVIRVRRGGALVLHDAIRLDGAVDAMLHRAAIGGGAGTVATLVHVAPDAEGRLEAVRGAVAAECRPSAERGALAAMVPAIHCVSSAIDMDANSSSYSAGAHRPTVMPGLDLGTPTGTMLRTPELPRRSGSRTEAAASAWNGMLVARILAPNGAALRRTVIAALSVLRESRPLPRVWMC